MKLGLLKKTSLIPLDKIHRIVLSLE